MKYWQRGARGAALRRRPPASKPRRPLRPHVSQHRLRGHHRRHLAVMTWRATGPSIHDGDCGGQRLPAHLCAQHLPPIADPLSHDRWSMSGVTRFRYPARRCSERRNVFDHVDDHGRRSSMSAFRVAPNIGGIGAGGAGLDGRNRSALRWAGAASTAQIREVAATRRDRVSRGHRAFNTRSTATSTAVRGYREEVEQAASWRASTTLSGLPQGYQARSASAGWLSAASSGWRSLHHPEEPHPAVR